MEIRIVKRKSSLFDSRIFETKTHRMWILNYGLQIIDLYKGERINFCIYANAFNYSDIFIQKVKKRKK